MKKLLCILVVVLLVFSVVGCQGQAPTTSAAASSAPASSVAASSAAASSAAASSRVVPDEINIGVVGSMSGDQAISGQALKDGIALVQSELTANPFVVDGKTVKVNFLFEDNEAKPEISVNAVQKLIGENCLAIIGPNNSSDAIPSGSVCQQAKIPMIPHTATNIKVTQVGDYIFRMCYIDPYQAKLAAKYADETLKAKKVAVLQNVGDAYSAGLHDAFVSEIKARNITLAADESFSGTDIKDYTAQLNNIKNAAPEVLFLPLDVNTVPLIMQQARRMGITAVFLGGDAWDYDVLAGLAGKDVIEGAQYITGFSKDQKSAAAFVEAFGKAVPGTDPGFANCMCYEAAHVVLNAIQNAKTIDGTGIRDAMLQTSMDLPTGHVTFDQDRNPVQGAVVLKFVDGVKTYVQDIN